jgi:hypothetical protein
VNAYELKINPNNESFLLPNPAGSLVQFENASKSDLQDGKLVVNPNNSWYRKTGSLPFARAQVLGEARRQVEAASTHGFTVEWLVSDSVAVQELTDLFTKEAIPIKVTPLAE